MPVILQLETARRLHDARPQAVKLKRELAFPSVRLRRPRARHWAGAGAANILLRRGRQHLAAQTSFQRGDIGGHTLILAAGRDCALRSARSPSADGSALPNIDAAFSLLFIILSLPAT